MEKGDELLDIWSGFQLNRKEPVYLQLTGRIKQLLVSGQLEDGAFLPSRRETAAQLEINPNTVQKAYKQLEEEGILSTDNSGSHISCPESTRQKLRKEYLRKIGKEFVFNVREMQLSFKDAMDLLSELWEE